ncbi:unnamed protein product [Blepharisma stoltei]|uniref:Uncharacterized protein n=1 Tax=Blepharisma stoltei TaxID=1481888 RepID=A0AAU9KFK9_9CILI|nr:unnamed protein product [Blepharisma stoltei]
MESTAYQYFKALCKYHEFVNNFISETINQESEKDNNYFRCSEHIRELRNKFSSLLEIDQSELLQDDILSCRNPFKLLFNLALNSQWNLLGNLDDFTNEECYWKFKTNLELFSSQKFYEMMTNLELNEEIRSLIRTLAIYFYIRIPSAWILNMDGIFRNKNKPKRIAQSKNSKQCLDFYRSLTSNSIVSDAFSRIDPNVSLDNLFSRVSDCSYYAAFPTELCGLTTIGDIVFVNKSFNLKDPTSWAATLIILLKESAHLMWRYCRGQSSYLMLTPKSSKQTGIEYNSEMGDFVEELIFGEKMVKINFSSAKFLLNRNNWDLSKEEFQMGLKMKYQEGKSKRQPVTKVRKGNSSTIYLGRCGMALYSLESINENLKKI